MTNVCPGLIVYSHYYGDQSESFDDFRNIKKQTEVGSFQPSPLKQPFCVSPHFWTNLHILILTLYRRTYPQGSWDPIFSSPFWDIHHWQTQISHQGGYIYNTRLYIYIHPWYSHSITISRILWVKSHEFSRVPLETSHVFFSRVAETKASAASRPGIFIAMSWFFLGCKTYC